ncbi:DNA-binding protein [uncultured Bacteroides sp.]|uniref:HU family DNA-binding protein n=1 Tax=uncultured Bacteroides sp. TaxID=162156 RepID=UPI0025E13B5A|nr:DNA-binding protein [uncultured Bacteroides sp.]
MSIHYDLYETPDIQQTGEEQPLHPRVVFKGTIDQEEFLDRVHKFTGMSRSMLAGAMQSFQNELRDLLSNGWIVEMGDIGHFSVSLQGPPVMNKKDVHAQSIKLKNINFRVGSQFKKEVGWQMKPERGESITRPHGDGRSEKECLALIEEHLQKYPCLTRTDYCRLTGHTKKRAINELNTFIDQGILIRYGAGKQVVYAKPNNRL